MALHTLVSANPVNTGRVFYGNSIPTAPDGNTYIPGDFIQFVPYPAGQAGPSANPPYGWWCVAGGAGGTAVWDVAGISPQFSLDSGVNNAIVVNVGAVARPPLTNGLIVNILLAHTLQAGANTLAYGGGAAAPVKSSYNPANDIATPYAVGGIIQLIYYSGTWFDMKQ